jgi:hypothetical protein
MKAIRIFISYSHQDRKRMEQLLKFVNALTRKGFEVWHDDRIDTGDFWDDEIKSAILSSHIAVVLVSQDFLNSAYCQTVEVSQFLLMRKSRGLVIYPVILSACNWRDEDWLSSTQVQPRGDKTVAEHFSARGIRDRLFLNIQQDLSQLGDRLRAA